jgi:hypothetical protein
MSANTHTRLAWGIALASLAVWAVSAPVAFSQITAWSAGDDSDQQEVPCPTPSSAAAESAPPTTTPIPSNAMEATFRLCGADSQAERSIEQLVAGRGFSTTLTSRGDGCADLLVRVTSPAVSGTGSISSNLSVSVGSGQTLSVRIVSENGATHAHIS